MSIRPKLYFLILILLVINISSYAYPKEERGITLKEKNGTDTAATLHSKYYALIIGNNNYKYLPKLKTAIGDAKAVDELLRKKYGFKTKLLIDATRKDLLGSMNQLRKELGEKDSLLIYYAGHGEFDKTVDKAYWLPVDAQRDDPTDWIIAEDITSNIKRITSKHVLIVSDSCYSGTLTRAASGDLSKSGDREEFIKKMSERPSRTLMASGGNEPVADGGKAGHSVFASAFLKGLEEEKSLFTAEELFHWRIKEVVAGKSDQVPEYNNIKNSGHEGGDFIFQLAGGFIQVEEDIKEPIEVPDTGILSVKSNVAGAKIYINDKYEGETQIKKTVSPGIYTITLEKEGYIPGKEKVRIERGKEIKLTIMLDSVTGSIEVSSEPSGGKVYIDGTYTGEAPNTIGDLRKGEYKIEVRKQGNKLWSQKVTVEEGKETAILATLEPESPPLVTTKLLDSDPIMGEPDAPITIIEFSEYQCPFCGRFAKNTLPEIINDFISTGKVKLIFKDYPLEFHKQAAKASEAAHCAGEQGKYWEMHDKLFQNQSDLGVDNLKKYAAEIGMERSSFNACLDVGKYDNRIKKNIEEGKKVDVSGTPTFFIGKSSEMSKEITTGKRIVGARPYSSFKEAIDEIQLGGQRITESKYFRSYGNGQKIFRANCVVCHGERGDGKGPAASAMTPEPTNFTSEYVMRKITDDRLIKSIKDGRPGTAMVGFGKTLKNKDIEEVAEYIRSLAGK